MRNIHSDQEYRDVMKRLDELFNRELTPDETLEFSRLLRLVEEYEQDMLTSWDDPT